MSSPNTKQRLATLVVIALGAALGWFALGIFKKSPEQEIEATLRKACDAAQDKSILRLSETLTQDYRDDGGIDRAAFMGQAQRFFMETENLEVKPELIRVEMDGEDNARALLVVKISGTEKAGGQRFQGIAGDGADAFLVRLRKETGGWKIEGSRRLRGDSPDDFLKQIE